MTPFDQLHALADAENAVKMRAYHKVDREYLGITVPQIETLTDAWRAEYTMEGRIALAADLWDSNIHEGRVAAAKLLAQARMKEGCAPAWDLICSWVPQFDAWSIADHVCIAAQKRIVADPSRIETVEEWTTHPNMWVRRAAMVATLPFTKQNHPKPFELEIRERVLGWAASYCADKDWFIQKCIAWWLRDLSKHDAGRVDAFLEEHGARMKPFARKEAAQYLPVADVAEVAVITAVSVEDLQDEAPVYGDQAEGRDPLGDDDLDDAVDIFAPPIAIEIDPFHP
jgi:3-methyladenine DNA glycosylase AlkD